MNEPQVILVDDNDQAIGTMGKQEAHVQGQLHRAISVLVFNTKGEWLIHQRAHGKYHCGGLWTNACCSHPAPGENSRDAAIRRLQEEMGIKAPQLEKLFQFKYEVAFENQLTEHEIDHVYKVVTNDIPDINTEEVAAYKYLSHTELAELIKKDPNSFTPWFKLIIEKFNNLNPKQLS